MQLRVGFILMPTPLKEWPTNTKQNVIFVRPFFSPEDVHGMLAADGLITLEGGAASNAAEMAQQFSKPYVTEVSAIEIDLEHRELVVNNRIHPRKGTGYL